MSELLSLSRLGRRLGLTQQWLRTEADAGRIPCLRAGNRYVFDLAAVQETLSQRAGRNPQGRPMLRLAEPQTAGVPEAGPDPMLFSVPGLARDLRPYRSRVRYPRWVRIACRLVPEACIAVLCIAASCGAEIKWPVAVAIAMLCRPRRKIARTPENCRRFERFG